MLLQSQLRRQDNLPLRRLGALRVRATLHHSAAPLCRIRRDCVYFLLRLRLLRLRLLRPIAAPNLPHLNSSERFKLCPLNSSRRSKTVPRRRKALFLEQESLPVFAVLPYGPAVWASRMGQPYGPAVWASRGRTAHGVARSIDRSVDPSGAHSGLAALHVASQGGGHRARRALHQRRRRAGPAVLGLRLRLLLLCRAVAASAEPAAAGLDITYTMALIISDCGAIDYPT